MRSFEGIGDFVVAVELVGAATLDNDGWFGFQGLVHS